MGGLQEASPGLKCAHCGTPQATGGTKCENCGHDMKLGEGEATDWDARARELLQEREFSPEKREALAKKGKALPHGGYPIENEDDLDNAITSFGRAGDKAAAKAHIIKNAKRLKLTHKLPDDWNVQEAEIEEADVPSSALPDLPNKPGKANWVEKAGGLPNYIERIAKHLFAKGMPTSRAIAVAVNVVKRMCATGDTNFPGAQQVNPKSRAEACAAVASWERKKAGTHLKQADVTPAVERALRLLEAGAADPLSDEQMDDLLVEVELADPTSDAIQEAAAKYVRSQKGRFSHLFGVAGEGGMLPESDKPSAHDLAQADQQRAHKARVRASS